MTTDHPAVSKQHPVRYNTIRVNELDVFEGAVPYPRDLKDVETHLLETGHFVLETHGEEIGNPIEEFLKKRKLAN